MKAGSPKPGKWVHYAGTYDRKKKPRAILFIDGKPVGEAAGDLPVSADWDQGARVGFNIDNKRPFTGMMDEVSVWEYGFSQEEIQEITKIPLFKLLESKNNRYVSFTTNNGRIDSKSYVYENKLIWGASARIISQINSFI